MSQLEALKNRLEKLGYTAQVFETAAQAKEYLLSAIPVQDSIGIGGCMTVKELGLDEALRARGQQVYWHWGVEPGQVNAMRARAATADTYLCSANAMVTDGRIINIDGFGNRLAATLFGPKKVYLIVGVNKLADTLDAAMDHIKNVSCPQNAKRLGLKTPCAVLGHCTDCASPDRMCHATLILERKPNSHPMEIVLVNEPLGYGRKRAPGRPRAAGKPSCIDRTAWRFFPCCPLFATPRGRRAPEKRLSSISRLFLGKSLEFLMGKFEIERSRFGTI